MRVTLSVNLESGENKEKLISAHLDVDDGIVQLEKETYHMLLSAVTSKMLTEMALETQAKIVDVMKENIHAIDVGFATRKMFAALEDSKLTFNKHTTNSEDLS